ncbi:hypothetical protein ABPG72_014117 [Tetrahymena utriculariae]
MQRTNQSSNHIVLFGVFIMFVNSSLSFSRLIIEILYYAKKSDSCSQSSQADSTSGCSSDLSSHLFKEQGFNFIIAVSILDAIIIFMSTIILLQIRKQSVNNCLQYSYLIILITSLILVILSYNQQGKYINSTQTEILQASCNASSSSQGCDFLNIQQNYRKCLIPFPIVQIVLSIVLKIYMEHINKIAAEALLQQEREKKKAEETTLDVHFYNSRGKPFTVLELYNMGKI